MKIGKVNFNKEAFKGMTFEEFAVHCDGKFLGVSVEDAYKKITGKNAKSSKKRSKPAEDVQDKPSAEGSAERLES